MTILVVQSGRAPVIAEIDGSLSSMQKIVGGTIQAIYPWEDLIALVCNDEGILLGMPLNRKIFDDTFIFGTFFLCGLSEDSFDSLPLDLMEKYKKRFAYPEMFLRMGDQILAIPIPDKNNSQ